MTSFKNIKNHKLENVGHGGQQKKSLQSQNTQFMLFIKCKMLTYLKKKNFKILATDA